MPPPPEDLAEPLLRQFQDQGFGDAFGVLWQHHHDRLGLFVRGRGLDAASAEDLTQEVGLKMFRYLSGYVVEIFPPNAYKITKDQIIDWYRKQGRQPKLESLEDLIAINLEPAAAPQSKQLEKWTAVQRHMTSCGVSPDQQTAVILHHLIGYTVAEVAQITESKPEAVKSRLRYAALKMGRDRRQEGAA